MKNIWIHILVATLLSGNAYFISRLVAQIDNTANEVSLLREDMARVKLKLGIPDYRESKLFIDK